MTNTDKIRPSLEGGTKTRIVYGTGVTELLPKDVLDNVPHLLEKSLPDPFFQGSLTLPTDSITILAQRRLLAEGEYAWFVGTEETGMDWIDRPRVEVAVSREAENLSEEVLSELVHHTVSSAGVGKPGRVAVHKSYSTPNGPFDTFMLIKPNEFLVHVGTPSQIKKMADTLAEHVKDQGGELTTWKSPKTKALLRREKRLDKKRRDKNG